MSTRVIAIDGPAGAGKSTIARRLARQLDYQLIDTGALYRTVAYVARREGVDWEDEEALAEIAGDLDLSFRRVDGDNVLFCDGEALRDEIRTQEIGYGARVVSAHPAVREALVEVQREMGESRSSVLEGRDIGTVVFPDADVKIFLTADPRVRARRRYDELREKGEDVEFDDILDEVEERDRRDRQRDIAPLTEADDAIRVDTSDSTIDEVVEEILAVIQRESQS